MTDTEARRGRENVVGQPLRRKEDARLVTGRTNLTDNIALPGLLYMAILRSPMAHARITRIDVTPALQARRVAAFSGKELGDKLGRCRASGRSPTTSRSRPTRRWPPKRCASSAMRRRRHRR